MGMVFDFRIAYGLVIAAAVISMAFLYLKVGDQANDLRSEVHARCVAFESQKTVLRREHNVKLARAVAYRDAHPRGTELVSLGLINKTIGDEREILKGVQPISCPDA